MIDHKQVNWGRQNITVTGTASNINWDNGAHVVLDVSGATGNVAVNFSNPKQSSYLMTVVQGATVRDIIFPAGTLQIGGGGATVTGLTTNGRDKIAIEYVVDHYEIAATLNYA